MEVVNSGNLHGKNLFFFNATLSLKIREGIFTSLTVKWMWIKQLLLVVIASFAYYNVFVVGMEIGLFPNGTINIFSMVLLYSAIFPHDRHVLRGLLMMSSIAIIFKCFVFIAHDLQVIYQHFQRPVNNMIPLSG